MIGQKTHHVLGNDGDDIVVFGQTSSTPLLSQTTLIQGDGTFTCVVSPFSQLYVFHTPIKNGVLHPLPNCLVRGKNHDVYKRLITIIENIAGARG